MERVENESLNKGKHGERVAGRNAAWGKSHLMKKVSKLDSLNERKH